MKRIVDYYLLEWKFSRPRKPLLLRGARQIGKTYAARQLGKTYENFVEINLEKNTNLHKAFLGNLDPQEIIMQLSSRLEQEIIPGKTLLFIDEIQACPQAIISLRYFYEELPELHVIAAGSLLDFAIAQVGVPVGRIQALYMRPVSFIEYLATFHVPAARLIMRHDLSKPIGEFIHEESLRLLARYIVIGGMPEAIETWKAHKNPLQINVIHTSILTFYRQDFNKYAKKHEIKYVEKIFKHVPQQLSKKFKYSAIEGEYRKRELSPALDLLVTAGVVHKVYYSAGQGVPLGGQEDELDYKVILLDTGLTQTSLKLNIGEWLTADPQQEFINKGALTEAFVGQELLAYVDPRVDNELFYWHKDSSPNQAEIDYLVEIGNKIIPIEVKSGDGRTLQSLHRFLETHPNSPYGVKFSIHNYSMHEKIHSYPLYAIAQLLSYNGNSMKNALSYLIAEPIIIHYFVNHFIADGDQSFTIVQDLLTQSAFENEIAIIDCRHDMPQAMFDQTIAGLQRIFSGNNSQINELKLQHKNLSIIQLMRNDMIVWQATIRVQ